MSEVWNEITKLLWADRGSIEKEDLTIHSGQFMMSRLDDEDNDQQPDTKREEVKIDSKNSLTYVYGQHRDHSFAIDASLTKLFECMTLAYSGKITSPRWKQFRGTTLTVTDKVRLNNIIWREWTMQYIYLRRSIICQFASPLCDDVHTKPEAVVLEGKYWKRKLDTVTAEYKKCRMYFKLRAARRCNNHLLNDASLTELLDQVGKVVYSMPGPQVSPELLRTISEEDFSMDFSDSLFTTLLQPFAFPSTREMYQHGYRNVIQPCLVQLQPDLDYMDTFDPLQEIINYQRFQLGASDDFSDSMRHLIPMSLEETSRMSTPDLGDFYEMPMNSQSHLDAPDMSRYMMNDALSPATISHQNALNRTFLQPQYSDVSPVYPLRATVASAPRLPAVIDCSRQKCKSLSSRVKPETTPPHPQQIVSPQMRQDVLIDDHRIPNQLQQLLQSPLYLSDDQILAMNVAENRQQYPNLSAAANFPAPISIQTTNNTQRINNRGALPISPLHSPSHDKRPTVDAKTFYQGGSLSELINEPVHNATFNSTKNSQIKQPMKSLITSRSKSTEKADHTAFVVPKGKPVQRRQRPIAPALSMGKGNTTLCSGNIQSTCLAQILATGKYTGTARTIKDEPSPVYEAESNMNLGLMSIWPNIAPAQPEQASAESARFNTPIVLNIPTVGASQYSPIDAGSALLTTIAGKATRGDVSATKPTATVKRATGTGSLEAKPLLSQPLSPPSVTSSLTTTSSPIVIESDTVNPMLSTIPDVDFVFLSSPGESEKGGHHEHRRVYHISAEKKRRCNIKSGFDMLHMMIPALKQQPNSKISKAMMLHKTAEFCRKKKKVPTETMR